MTTRREIILDALDGWQREGAVDPSTHRALRERYQNAPAPDPRLDAPLVEAHAPHSVEPRREEGASSAAAITQFVGGLLLGAAIVALMPFLGLEQGPAQWSLIGLGLLPILGAVALQISQGEQRDSIVQAAFAAGFVPLIVAGALAVADENQIAGGAVAIAAVAIHAFRRGRGPAVGVAAIAAIVGTLAMSGAPQIFDAERGTLEPVLWLALLVGYLTLSLAWRHESWSSATSGLLVLPLALAYVSSLQALFGRQNSLVGELLVGIFLGALLALGISLGVRALTATSAAGLTIDAVVFAFDVGGALTAVLVLLALGGLLVWQGGPLLRYFRRKPA